MAFIESNKSVSSRQILEHIQRNIGDVTKMTITRDLDKLLKI